MSEDLTPAEWAIFHTYGQEDIERTRAIVAAVRPHIIIETLRNAEMTLAESGLRTVNGVRRWLRECADEIQGGSDAR